MSQSHKAVATYFLLYGACSVVWQFVAWSNPGLGLHTQEFAALSTATKAGAYSREFSITLAFLLAGAGILLGKPWARKLGLFVLLFEVPYGGVAFAWGFAHGRPPSTILWISVVGFAVWNLFWFFLLLRKPPSASEHSSPPETE